MLNAERCLTSGWHSRLSLLLLPALLLAGCGEKPTAPSRTGTATSRPDPGPPPEGQSEPEPAEMPGEAPGIELPAPTPDEPPATGESTAVDRTLREVTTYYRGGPQQASPPDGEFPAGTRVRIVQPAGSYTLIETETGLRAYVASDSLTARALR